VLVTGGHGQVGTEVVAAFEGEGRHEVVAPGRELLDLTSRDAVLQIVDTCRPDVVIHAGAWTDVDGCELDPDRAFATNALGTRHVAEGARRTGAHLLYLSTDYVFSGDLDRPYREWDEPNPLSVYGRSKLAGEREAAAAAATGATVVRTSWVCGKHGSNMVKTVLRLATATTATAATADPAAPLLFVDDQRGSPTFVADLAPAIRDLAVSRRPGTFHVTNQGHTTWYGLARAVLQAAGHDPDRIRPIKTSELQPARPAPRPVNSVLDNAALRLAGLPLLPGWEESLGRLVEELVA
jgi:dTDP-4-dehydrorhamnose reductase